MVFRQGGRLCIYLSVLDIVYCNEIQLLASAELKISGSNLNSQRTYVL